MTGRGPDGDAWGRALGWQLLMFVQVALATIYGAINGALAYLAIWGFELLTKLIDSKSWIVKALGDLKEVAFLAIVAAYSIVEVVHLINVVRDSHSKKGDATGGGQ